MFALKKKSGWTFTTSGGGGVSFEFLAAEGGRIYLRDPSRTPQAFSYGAAGAGVGFGFKLPKVGKLPVNAAAAPTAFPNAGAVYMLNTFTGQELTRSDIAGVCMVLTVGGGLGAGLSGTGLLFGMDPAFLAVFLATSSFPPLAVLAETKLLQSATGLLIMGGLNAGVQAGGGAAAMLGGLA